jgi:serine/threonine protein kinase
MLSDYEILRIVGKEGKLKKKILGKGGQGKVFEVKSKIDGKSYAAKKLEYAICSEDKENEKEKEKKNEALREISCLRALNHPLIMGLVDLVKYKDKFPCIIMEMCN